MRLVVLFCAFATALCASITNECSSTSADPCRYVTASHGYLSWSWGEGEPGEGETIHLGFTQDFKFTGRPTGTPGYVAFYAVNSRHVAAAYDVNDVYPWVSSNLALNDYFDPSSTGPIPPNADYDLLVPFQYGVPLTLVIDVSFGAGYTGYGYGYGCTFDLFQWSVFDANKHPLVSFNSVSLGESGAATFAVPTAATPEPATQRPYCGGNTRVSSQVIRSRRKTKRG